jgi:hypothetical protein
MPTPGQEESSVGDVEAVVIRREALVELIAGLHARKRCV